MSSTSHRSDVEYSRGDHAERDPSRRLSTARGALALCGLGGIAGLVVATLSPVQRIEVAGRIRPAFDRTGWDVHGPALVLVAGVALVLLVLAVRGSRAAALGLAVCGLVAIGIAVLGDLPDIGDSGLVGERLVEGTVRAGIGAFAEVLGGVLLLLAGGVLASLDRGE